MEKITFNITPVDLGRIDMLVEEGFYQNRSDFIRAAIRREMDCHQGDLAAKGARMPSWTAGTVRYARQDLEARAREGDKLQLYGVGNLVIEPDVPASLVEWVFGQVRWYGKIEAQPAIVRVLERKRT
jgi:Arc/MetJ-type ribon-helix-helix transcriptional regulator